MSNIKVTHRKFTSGDKAGQSILGVESPYSSEFVAGAHKLNGTFNSTTKMWLFNPQIEDKVRALLISVYGEDGAAPVDKVTLRVTTPTCWSVWRGSIELAGRVLARATGRDSGARLGEDVILTAGKIKSGGSAKNWSTEAIAGTTFEILDIPRSKAEAEISNPTGDLIYEIVEPAAAKPVDVCEGRRASLLTRIAKLEHDLASVRAELAAHDKVEAQADREETDDRN